MRLFLVALLVLSAQLFAELSAPVYFYDEDHVRYELASTHPGKSYNWLFFPGGPGCDAGYLHALLKLVELPGNCWLIDLPGNGSNTPITTHDYDYDAWFELFPKVVERFARPVVVGHSFGGVLALLTPQLEGRVKGLVLLNTTPRLWLEAAAEYGKRFSLPDLGPSMAEFTAQPSDATFKAALDACLPYYFPPHVLEERRGVLSSVPFQYRAAVWGQKMVLARNYSATWIPETVPTLIVTGTYDCVVPPSLFQEDTRFHRPNIFRVHFDAAGHFPWLDEPAGVKTALTAFSTLLKE